MDVCFSLLEETLVYIHSVACCVEDNSDKPTAKLGLGYGVRVVVLGHGVGVVRVRDGLGFRVG